MKPESDVSRETTCSRRRFLGRTAAVLAAPLLAPLAGCGAGEQDAPPAARIPLGEIPPGTRREILVGGDPVEISRTGDTVTARSLLCTHQGCRVRWDGQADRYRCPCHDGEFDARGRPVAGPPQRPLRELSARIADGHVVVEPAGRAAGSGAP